MACFQAFDNALVLLDGLNDETYKEDVTIMHLIRDNLSLWQNTRTLNEDDDEDEEEYAITQKPGQSKLKIEMAPMESDEEEKSSAGERSDEDLPANSDERSEQKSDEKSEEKSEEEQDQ